MSKVVLTLGDTPAECSITIDGKKVDNAVAFKASVDIENGPSVSYSTMDVSNMGPTVEVHDVEFKPIMEK